MLVHMLESAQSPLEGEGGKQAELNKYTAAFLSTWRRMSGVMNKYENIKLSSIYSVSVIWSTFGWQLFSSLLNRPQILLNWT